jgi:arginyl-tRNA synthetase
MKLLVSEKPGNEELKCYIALAYTGATFTVGTSDQKYTGCGPQIVVATTKGTNSVVFSANAVCRYIGLEKNALQVEDLVVEDWIQWESHILAPWIAKSKKNPNADKKELAKSLTILLELKEETRPNKTDSFKFLFSNELTLADIVVGVTLRAALELVGTEQTPILTKFRNYLKNLFGLPAFIKGLSLLQSGGKPASKLDKMSGTTQHNVLAIVEAVFSEALQNAFPDVKDLPAIEVTRTKSASFGDYQCNSAMTIFGKLKGTPNAPRSPREVAQAIINNIPSNTVVENPSVAGPGFINVFLTESFLTNRIETILLHGVKASPSKKMIISVDFSSPNIAKDMHVGHLRSTIIGDAMSRILEFQGHHVNRINHVGDWGTQFGMLICHLMDTFPDWEIKMPNVTDLTQLYKAAKLRFDEDEDFHQRSKQQVVLLQGGDQQSRRVWTTLCEISRKEFQKVYDRLQVRLNECGESFYFYRKTQTTFYAFKIGWFIFI